MQLINKGDFVRVGKEVGVVVFIENENHVPEEHLGIWYGEVHDQLPQYRTVPAEYCEKIEEAKDYH